MRLFNRKTNGNITAARRERSIPVTADDLSEVTRVCASALSDAIGHLRDTQMTRGGIVVRGTAVLGNGACQVMRTALESVGYVLGDAFGRDGVVVIGWDPARYSGAQVTVARLDDRIEELLALRAQLLNAELDAQARL
ncbi:hypothetical protein ACWEPC_01980 [Nonomuraea sp. NPDC004297]